MKQLRIGLVGYGKMSRAHSQAYLTALRFFHHETQQMLAEACGRTSYWVARRLINGAAWVMSAVPTT